MARAPLSHPHSALRSDATSLHTSPAVTTSRKAIGQHGPTNNCLSYEAKQADGIKMLLRSAGSSSRYIQRA
eukprot:6316120-Prymnesium_polylepis.1